MREFFTRLYGNAKTKERIGSAIANRTENHAYLISGPKGSGKSTLALEIAAALNCENREKSDSPLPCCRCNTCRRIYEGSYTDIKFLRRDSQKATIGVDELRLFREDMFLSATESDCKLYVIEEADKMTPNAQNALLKVLEEPPEDVIVLLLTESAEAMLTTIKSRSQIIYMQRFTHEEILDFLKNKMGTAIPKITDELMGADGRIGAALESLNSSGDIKAKRAIVTDIVSSLRQGVPYSSLYTALSALPQKRAELSDILEETMLALCDLIRLKFHKDAPLTFFYSRSDALEIASSITAKKLLSVCDAVSSAIDENNKNANISALTVNLGAKIKLI